MKRFAKTIVFLLIWVIPARICAQDYREYENGFLFNVFGIENVEERVQLASALATSDIWLCNPTENPGELYIRPNSYHADLPIYAEFDYLMMTLKEEYEEASLLPKEEFKEIFNSWAHNISNEYYNFLISDHLDRANHCMDAEPFCTSDVYNFPALNSGYSWSGPNYGCLNSSPTNKHSFWYYMRIGVAGNITILIEASFDVDFALWGPFNNQTDPCPTEAGQAGMLTANCTSCPNNTSNANFYPSGNLHDCCFDARHYEYAHVVDGQVGQYYILLITNYSGSDGYITFQKYDGDGETDCGIMPGIASNDGPYCEGETIHLTVNEQNNATYDWTGPDGWTSTEPHPTRPNCTMDMAGIYTIVTTVGAQTTPATTLVEVYQQAVPSFTATTVCQGETTDFNGLATGTNVANYDWDFGDGNTESGQNVSHTYAQAGTYDVTLTVSAADGSCPGQITQTVTVNTQPVANAGPDQTVDYGNQVQLNGSGGGNGFTYHWDEPEPGLLTNLNIQNPQTTFNWTQELEPFYVFTLTVTNPQGNCTSTDEVIIYTQGSALTASIEADSYAFCKGGSTQITVTALFGTGNYTYSWSHDPSLYNHSTITVTPSQTTTYTCTISDGQTTQTVSTTVTVNQPETLTPQTITGRCDAVPISWVDGQGHVKDTTFYENTVYTFIGQTEFGCHREQTFHIEAMQYAPQPTGIIPEGEEMVISGDTIFVVTNTEFFSFQYTFKVEETGNSVWDSCVWSINKPSWELEVLTNTSSESSCRVYVAEREEDPVILKCIVYNGCNEDGETRLYYLKSSFLDIDEHGHTAANISIVPNPNSGQMRIDFENMEGRTAVKVFDMAGSQIDAFETNVGTNRYSYDYTMKQYAEGIYFFVISNDNRVFTKKVVIIQ